MMQPEVENVLEVQLGLLKVIYAVVPDVVGEVFVNAIPPALYPVPETSSLLPVRSV